MSDVQWEKCKKKKLYAIGIKIYTNICVCAIVVICSLLKTLTNTVHKCVDAAVAVAAAKKFANELSC